VAVRKIPLLALYLALYKRARAARDDSSQIKMIKRDTSPLGLMMLNAHRPQKETLAAAREDGLLLFSLSLGWVLLELHKPVF
jgi:hypothetical protein